MAKALALLATLNGDPNHSCKFAVRGGGQTSFAGSANIAGGITTDMRDMNQVVASPDRTLTSVSSGALWTDVYQSLDPLGLSVVGGRPNLVGVAGLTTGGGISFFSPREGFVCDNVQDYEIVLANGTVLNVTRRSSRHSDLLRALRGGSKNFGIVTRLDLRTFPQGKLWGGDIVYNISTLGQQLDSFVAFGSNPHYDQYAALF